MSPRIRAKLLERLKATPAKVRHQLVKELRDTQANLGKLLDEIEAELR